MNDTPETIAPQQSDTSDHSSNVSRETFGTGSNHHQHHRANPAATRETTK